MMGQGGGNIQLSKTTNPRWTAPEVIRDSRIGPEGGRSGLKILSSFLRLGASGNRLYVVKWYDNKLCIEVH
jgi:hypothetical protein